MARIVNRGATDPASTTDPAWAGVLAPALVGEFFSALPQSAGSKLIAASPAVTLQARATVSFPRPTAPPAYVPWIGEGAAIPVASFPVTSGAVLGPGRKFAIITVASIELYERSDAETVFSTMLRETAGRTLDAAVFDGAPASAIRPAGLLDGVAPLTATSGGGLCGDVGRPLAACRRGGVGGRRSVKRGDRGKPDAGGCHPGRIADLKIRIWSTTALAAGVVIALDATGFASAFTGEPDIESSRDAAVHLNSAPLPIGTPGTPPTVAAPVVSAFQSGLVVTRLIVDAAWTMRGPGLVAHLAGATW